MFWWIAVIVLAAAAAGLAVREYMLKRKIDEMLWARVQTGEELASLFLSTRWRTQMKVKMFLGTFETNIPKEEHIFMYNAVMAVVNFLKIDALLRRCGWIPASYPTEEDISKLVGRALKGAYKLADGHFWESLLDLRELLVETKRTHLWQREHWAKTVSALTSRPFAEGMERMRPHLWALRREHPDIAEDAAASFARAGNYPFLWDLYQDPSMIPAAHLEAVSDAPKGNTSWEHLLAVRIRLGEWDRIVASIADITDPAIRGSYLDAIHQAHMSHLLTPAGSHTSP